MQDIQDQITELPDQDFRALKAWVITTETTRRAQEPAVRAAKQEIVKEYQAQGVLPAPVYATEAVEVEEAAEWVDPGTNHALMYPAGAVVQHSGKLWRSGVDLNHWEPGAPGVHSNVWLDITPKPVLVIHPDDDDTPTVQPYEDNRHYKAGEVRSFNDHVYECAQDHYAAPGWTPENAHAMWTVKTDQEEGN